MASALLALAPSTSSAQFGIRLGGGSADIGYGRGYSGSYGGNYGSGYSGYYGNSYPGYGSTYYGNSYPSYGYYGSSYPGYGSTYYGNSYPSYGYYGSTYPSYGYTGSYYPSSSSWNSGYSGSFYASPGMSYSYPSNMSYYGTADTQYGSGNYSGSTGYPYGSLSGETSNRAFLSLRLPVPDAEVWIEGDKTQQMGFMRTYVSPPLDTDKRYSYEIKARWNENGREVTRTKKVPVRPNAAATADFTVADRGDSDRDNTDRSGTDRSGTDRDRTSGSSDLDRLQGTWTVTDTFGFTKDTPADDLKDMRVVVKDRQMTAQFGQRSGKARFTLDDTATPHQMDITIDDGPDNVKGKTLNCIYSLEGNVFKVSFRNAGEKRPSDFNTRNQADVHEVWFKKSTK